MPWICASSRGIRKTPYIDRTDIPVILAPACGLWLVPGSRKWIFPIWMTSWTRNMSLDRPWGLISECHLTNCWSQLWCGLEHSAGARTKEHVHYTVKSASHKKSRTDFMQPKWPNPTLHRKASYGVWVRAAPLGVLWLDCGLAPTHCTAWFTLAGCRHCVRENVSGVRGLDAMGLTKEDPTTPPPSTQPSIHVDGA